MDSPALALLALRCPRNSQLKERSIKRTPPGGELGEDAETVVLDFVYPPRTGRRLFGGARQARLITPNRAL